MSDFNDASAKRLWRSQPTEVPPMSTTYLQHRARELQRAVRLRNFIEQGSCVLALLICSGMIFTAPDLWLRASMALLIVGIGWAMFQWRRRVREGFTSAAADTGLAFYLRELEHKRDLHKTLWRWYMLPMIPGTVVLLTWIWFGDPNTRGTPAPWFPTALTLAWIVGTLIYERVKAAQYQREIDALVAGDAKPSARSKG